MRPSSHGGSRTRVVVIGLDIICWVEDVGGKFLGFVLEELLGRFEGQACIAREAAGQIRIGIFVDERGLITDQRRSGRLFVRRRLLRRTNWAGQYRSHRGRSRR